MKRNSKAAEPSKAALREMPEVNFAHAKVRRNPYAKRAAREAVTIRVTHAQSLDEARHDSAASESVRLPARMWNQLARKAKAEGLPVRDALRAAVLAWVGASR